MYAGLFDVTTDNKTLDVAVDGKSTPSAAGIR